MSNLEVLKKQKVSAVQNVRQLLVNDQARKQLADVAAAGLGADKFFQLSVEAIRKVPKLQNCDPMSFLNAMMQFASLGLEPNTPLGHAYLIPFGKEVTAVIGYKGAIDMAMRHPNVVSIHADLFYTDDLVAEYEYGSNQILRHKPGPRQGKIIAAYCHVRMKDGEAFVVVPYEEIMKIRDNSPGWKSAVKYGSTQKSPWYTHEPNMCRKTAVKALFNSGEMPVSTEFSQVMSLDDTRIARRDAISDFDPNEVIPDDDDGETIDGTAEELVEDEKPKPKPRAKPKPKEKEPDQPEEKSTELPQVDGPSEEEKAAIQQKMDEEAALLKKHQASFTLISGDALDAGAEAALEEHKSRVDLMLKEAPDLHADLMKELGVK